MLLLFLAKIHAKRKTNDEYPILLKIPTAAVWKVIIWELAVPSEKYTI